MYDELARVTSEQSESIMSDFTGNNFTDLGERFKLAPLAVLLLLKIHKHELCGALR